MPTPPIRPFRFGVQVKNTGDRASWVELARRIEGNGYDTLTMPDHYDEQFAPVPALQCAADATTTLRLGAAVYDNDYKHPAILAKELATMDVLSEGRLQIGLGAGWMRSDYDQLGIPYDSPGVRIERFLEGLAIIRSAFKPEPFSFEGSHYTITDYNGLPKPVQTNPPVMIGGGGPRVLGLAARHADIVGVNATMTRGVIDLATMMTMTADAVDEKIAVVVDAATEAARLDQIELSNRVFMMFATDDNQAAIDRAIDTLVEFSGAERTLIEESPLALVGPPSKIADDLVQRRQRWGFSYVIVNQNDVEAFAPVVAALAGT